MNSIGYNKEQEKLEAIAIAVNFLKQAEGFRAESYKDVGGVWTIGFGRTEAVRPWDVTTEDVEEAWLERRVRDELDFLERVLPGNTLPAGALAALISLSYNIGRGSFMRSSVRAGLLAGQHDVAANGFILWRRVKGRVVAGLERRRVAEAELFLKAIKSRGVDA